MTLASYSTAASAYGGGGPKKGYIENVQHQGKACEAILFVLVFVKTKSYICRWTELQAEMLMDSLSNLQVANAWLAPLLAAPFFA